MLTDVEWKGKVWKKKIHNRENRSLMRISSKIDSRIWELHKEWTEAGSRHQEPPHRRVKEIWLQLLWEVSYLAKEKKNWTVAQWSKFVFLDESKFCISFRNKVLESGGRVEKLIAQVAWSSVLSLHSLWWFGVQCHLLVLVHQFWCAWLASKLTIPEPYRESMGYCQEENEKQETKNADELKATVKEPGLPYHLSSATNWSPPCHAELRQ